MLIQNAINKLSRAGYSVSNKGQFFVATKQGHKDSIEFSKNGRVDQVVCIRVIPANDTDDLMSDYCSGVFVDNISQALRLAK